MYHVLLRCLPGAGGSGRKVWGRHGRYFWAEEGGRGHGKESPLSSLVTPGGAGPLTSSFPTVAMQDDDLYAALKRPEQHSEPRKQGFADGKGAGSKTSILPFCSHPRDAMRGSTGRTNVWVLCLEGQLHRLGLGSMDRQTHCP